MKRLLCAMFYLAAMAAPASAATPGEPVLDALRGAETIRLLVSQAYIYATRETAEKKIMVGFTQPYARTVRDLLEGAGRRVVEPAAGEIGAYDATLEITANGRAIARLYDKQVGGYLFTGAEIIGNIAFSTPASASWNTAFRSVSGPLLNVSINLGYDRPEGAPFREAFSGPTSFIARIVNVIGKIYGAPSLIAALDNRDDAVRLHAAKNLGSVGGDAARSALLNVIADSDARLRKEAAWSLGRMGDARAIEALTTALDDRDGDVRWFAAWALDKIAKGAQTAAPLEN